MIEFILGMLTALIFIPVADGIASTILTFFEMLKMKMGVKISQGNKAINDMNTPTEDVKHIIGFGIPGGEENYEEDEDDDI